MLEKKILYNRWSALWADLWPRAPKYPKVSHIRSASVGLACQILFILCKKARLTCNRGACRWTFLFQPLPVFQFFQFHGPVLQLGPLRGLHPQTHLSHPLIKDNQISECSKYISETLVLLELYFDQTRGHKGTKRFKWKEWTLSFH